MRGQHKRHRRYHSETGLTTQIRHTIRESNWIQYFVLMKIRVI